MERQVVLLLVWAVTVTLVWLLPGFPRTSLLHNFLAVGLGGQVVGLVYVVFYT